MKLLIIFSCFFILPIFSLLYNNGYKEGNEVKPDDNEKNKRNSKGMINKSKLDTKELKEVVADTVDEKLDKKLDEKFDIKFDEKFYNSIKSNHFGNQVEIVLNKLFSE